MDTSLSHVSSNAMFSPPSSARPLKVCYTKLVRTPDRFIPGIRTQGRIAGAPPPPAALSAEVAALASRSSDESLARQSYSAACEDAINYQINFDYNASYTFLVLFAYFDRDNIALPGFARFFEDFSNKERARALKLMKYQNIRGGKVKVELVYPPPMTDFNDVNRGDALHAMEYTLSLARIINNSLIQLHQIASKEGDSQLQDFIEEEFLKDQVEVIKMISDYVSKLRRVGKGHGVYHMDHVLSGEIINRA